MEVKGGLHRGKIKSLVALLIFIAFLWSSSNLILNIKNIDRDGDNLDDKYELSIGTNPLDIDTDGDGLNDFYEYYYWINRSEGKITNDFYNYWFNYSFKTYNEVLTDEMLRGRLLPNGNIDKDNYTNICDSDSDNDGVADGDEIRLNLDPALPEGHNLSNAASGGGDGGGDGGNGGGGSGSGNGNSGNSGDGGGSAGGGGSSSISDLKAIPTKTEVTSIYPDNFHKKSSFNVEGYVLDKYKKGVKGISVAIFVNKTKNSPGGFSGWGISESNGYFNISCNAPEDTLVGTNHIVAHALGNITYQESWSDPVVEIYSDSILTLNMSELVDKSTPFKIRGSLTDTDGVVQNNKEIEIIWDNSSAGKTFTDENGNFTLNYTYARIGDYQVIALFKGDKDLSSSKDNQTVSVKDLRTRLEVLLSTDKVEREKKLTVEGSLFNGEDNPISSAQIKIYYNENETSNAITSYQGHFEKEIEIPKDSTLGENSILVIYPGNDLYGSADAEETINVEESLINILNNNILIIIAVVISIGIGGVILSLLKKQNIEKGGYSLRDVALQTINQLKSATDLRKAVLDGYNAMCNWLDQSGMRKDVDKTPREFAADIKKTLNVSDECLISLTKIFEKACYSEYEINTQDRDAAIECLNEIATSLIEPASTPEVEEIKK